MKQTHRAYFDLMRIVAIIFVIYNHTSQYGFALYTLSEPGSGKYWAYLVLSIFCTFAVPLFFMISGALVLPKADIPDVWKRRIPKQTLILVLFSLFYHIYATLLGDATQFATLPGNSTAADLPGGMSGSAEASLSLPSAGMFLTVLYSGAWNFSFWFLYAYLAFLISAPLLRTLAEHMTNQQYYYLFALDIVFKALVPVLNWTVFKGQFTLNSWLMVSWVISDIVIYPLAGYFFEHRFDIRTLRQKRWVLPALWGATVVCLLVAAAMTYRKSLLTGVYTEAGTQTFHRVFNLVVAGTMFLSLKYALERVPREHRKAHEKRDAVLKNAGACTFGIYLLHVAVLKSDLLSLTLAETFRSAGWPRLGIGLVQVLITLLVCWAVTAVYKLLEGLVKRGLRSRQEVKEGLV